MAHTRLHWKHIRSCVLVQFCVVVQSLFCEDEKSKKKAEYANFFGEYVKSRAILYKINDSALGYFDNKKSKTHLLATYRKPQTFRHLVANDSLKNSKSIRNIAFTLKLPLYFTMRSKGFRYGNQARTSFLHYQPHAFVRIYTPNILFVDWKETY